MYNFAINVTRSVKTGLKFFDSLCRQVIGMQILCTLDLVAIGLQMLQMLDSYGSLKVYNSMHRLDLFCGSVINATTHKQSVYVIV